MAFQWDQGKPGGLGEGDLQRARAAGYSDAQILEGWLGTSLPIGDFARKELLSSVAAPKTPTPSQSFGSTSGGGSSGGASTGSSTSELLAYQRQLDEYRNEASTNAFKLADYESQLNRYKTDLDTAKNQYKEVLGRYDESSAKIGTLGQELEKVKADSELYRSELDNYKKDTITQQLDVPRRGTGTNQGPPSGPADLTSGGTAVTRAPRRDRGVNVVANVDTTDSVLDRRGPTVEVMRASGAAPSNRVQARQRSIQAAGSGSAAGYYASRFG